jgi:hypothetical protein
LQLCLGERRIVLKSSFNAIAYHFALIYNLNAWVHQVSDPEVGAIVASAATLHDWLLSTIYLTILLTRLLRDSIGWSLLLLKWPLVRCTNGFWF